MNHFTEAKAVVVQGTQFERDGKYREVVRLIPANRFGSAAVDGVVQAVNAEAMRAATMRGQSGSKRLAKSPAQSERSRPFNPISFR